MTRLLHLPLIVAALALGCVHVGPVTEIGQLATHDTRVYVSSSRYDDGTIHRAVVERESTRPNQCEQSEITRFEYAKDGALRRRVHESRECGVVTFEIVDKFDPESFSVVTTAYFDRNRDGRFDEERKLGRRDTAIPQVPATSVVLAFGGDSIDDLLPVGCEVDTPELTTIAVAPR